MVKPKVERQKEVGSTVPAFRSELGSRLRELEKGFTNRETAAKAAGAAKSTFQSWIEGKADPSFEGLASFARQTGVSLDWLAGMSADASRGRQIGEDRGMVAIPVFEFEAGAGPGMVAYDEKPVDHLWFNETWLRQTYGVNPNDLKMLPSSGDSMEPTISSGAMLLVNTSKTARLPGDGIFVVRLEGDILVKRLQRVPGGKIKVSSDNAAYDAFHVSLDDGGVDFALLGRVVVAVDLKRL